MLKSEAGDWFIAFGNDNGSVDCAVFIDGKDSFLSYKS